ncbi:hypothetical protein [Acaryochloris marina]|uniref:Lipoprotein n=1 Tax=Acaryochloris marina (strain MBIC 11017) TaxID=329726 RepID=B0C6V0_ACAM1|nr:hypothetical protein [Acaryochloris marina]ABW27654.1 hypothetical protein AM1_2647 [Acaryochloris marina MBIC11017]BDM82389.1 hypothetical protein AM10699_52500 [Acaryochloris marina MBIC10699]
MRAGLFRDPRSTSCSGMTLGSLVLVGTLLVGCGAPSTPIGPLGQPFTFSEYEQEPDQSSVQEPEETPHQATFRLGESQAELRLAWKSIKPKNHAYLSSAAIEVVKADPNLSITMGDASNPVNIGTSEVAIEQRSLLITWHRQGWLQSQSKTLKINFSANGEWTVE